MISYAIKFWFQGKTDGQTSQVFTTLAFAWLLLKISLTDSHTAVKLKHIRSHYILHKSCFRYSTCRTS